jgi:hypothetical protein
MKENSMATSTDKVTFYGVARGEKLISGGWSNVDMAKNEVELYTLQMRALDLDPDVRLVEYDVETTVKTGRVRAYREPETEEPTPTVDEDATADGDAA